MKKYKFKIGDTVYYYDDSKVRSAIIHKIDTAYAYAYLPNTTCSWVFDLDNIFLTESECAMRLIGDNASLIVKLQNENKKLAKYLQ